MGFELDYLDQQLLSPKLPPVRMSTASAAADDDGGCATPTSAANVLRAPPVPPPAPRKPRPARAKRKTHCHCYRVPSQAARYYWIVAGPHDLAGMFVARRPLSSTGGSLCRAPAGKKIRVHVVG